MRLLRAAARGAKSLGGTGGIDGAISFNFPTFAVEFGGCIETDQADGHESLQSARSRRSQAIFQSCPPRSSD